MAEKKQITNLDSLMNKNPLDFHRILDKLSVAIYATDSEGRLIYFNQEAVEFSGRTPELGTDKWCVTWKLFWPDGTPMPHDECPMAVSIKEERSINGAEAIAETPDGERKWFKAYPSPLRNDKGEIIGSINMLIDVTEQKKAEGKLLQNEQELNDFFENANVGIHWVRSDGTIKRVNQAELDMLGYTRKEYVGNHIADFHADQDVIDDILTRLNNGEELQDYEARLRCKDGSIKYVLINTSVYEQDGEFIHTRCVTRDITERKEIKRDLRKSEERYRTLFDSIDEGFCIIKMLFDEERNPVNYRYLQTNPAYEKHTGLKDVEGKTAQDTLPNLEESWYEKYGKVALTGEPERFEKYNSELQRWYRIYAFRFGKPRERKVAVLFNDITDRKENEFSNAFLSAIVKSSDDAIVSKNLDGIITSWNDSAEQMFGYTADEAVGQHVTLIIPDNRIHEEDKILSQLRRGEKIDHFETVRERKDGSLLDISLTVSPIRNPDGEIIGASKIARDITEQKEAERKLMKNKNRLRTALQIETVGVLFWGGDDFTITEVNDAFLDMCGYSREELLGKNWRELTPEEYYPVSEQGVEKLKETGYPEPYEKQYIRKDGSHWWGLCAPRRIDDNEVVEFVLDITERKKAAKEREELLRKVENERERLENIFKQAPSFMCILQGPDHVIKRTNDLYQELIGNRDVIGKPVLEALPEVKGQGFVEKLDQVYETGEAFHAKDMPLALRRSNGNGADLEYRYLNFVYQPMHEPDGSVTGVFVQGLDITERKEAEKALRKSEEKYRTLFESMDEGYCIIKMMFDDDDNPVNYRFLEVNDAFEKHTGMTDVDGKTMREMVPEHEDEWFEIYGEVVRKQEPKRFEQSAMALGRVLELYAYPFGDPENKKVAVLFNDITERKRNQQKLQQMNETLEEKVEKRTASLKSYQEQLRRLAVELSKTEEKERQRLATDLHDNLGQILAVGKMRLEALNKISKSTDVKEGVDELKSIMDNAIDYSRKLVTDLKPPPSLDIENLQESISWIAERMQKHGLDVTVEDDGKPKEFSEEVRTTIFQCARELLFNVIKHAGVNQAQVIMTRPDGFVKIDIEDKGKGFELTGEQPTPTKEGGFGLFSIRERLNVVGGDLEITSEPGKGTRVTMRVPIEAADGPEPELSQGEVSTSSYPYEEEKPKKITKVLIVDDHRMMREGLRKMIEDEEDMKVIAEASDGKEAVEMAKEHQVDVIVMDVNMPKLNGIDATEEVITNNPQMRVIGLSFHKEESVAQAMRDAGASAYLTKSDVFETLCATIRSEMQSTEQQSEEE